MPSDETFLVTGALGCIGAWTLNNLAAAGARTIAADIANDPSRVSLVLSPAAMQQITFMRADVTNLESLSSLIERERVTHVIHLAGLQVPSCKANPSLGAQVNVVGTVNVFEAVRRSQGQVRGLSYASSVAVFGPPSFYSGRVADDAPPQPQTLYGVYKLADENVARLYWQDWQVASVGLRPFTVYGVGRDQGLTSDVSKAILAAAAGVPYRVRFDGLIGLQYADDVARLFIRAALAGVAGAPVCNVRDDVIDVGDVLAAIRDQIPTARITCASGSPLPFPADVDDAALRRTLGAAGALPHTPIAGAIKDSVERYQALLAQGRVDLSQLDA